MGWKELLYKEPLQPPKIDFDNFLNIPESLLKEWYDAAARKAARIIFEAARKKYIIAEILGRIYYLKKQMTFYGPLSNVQKDKIWQDRFLDLISFLDYALEKEIPQSHKEVHEIGLSMLQASWAIQAAAYALAEEGYFNKYGSPKKSLFK